MAFSYLKSVRQLIVHVSHVLSHIQLFVSPWTVAPQASLSMGFSRQEHQSGLPFPPTRGCPNPGTEPESPTLAGRFFTTEPLQSSYSRKSFH